VHLARLELDALPSEVQELQGLEQTPALTFHELGACEHHAESVSLEGVDEHRTPDGGCVVDEGLHLRDHFVLRVQNGLRGRVTPVLGELTHSNLLPVVRDVTG